MQASSIAVSTRKNSDDDSGTTSDVPSSVIDDSLTEFPESFDQQQTVSFERILADKSNFHSLPWRNSTTRMSRSLQANSETDRTQTRTFAITGCVENRRSRSIDRDSLNRCSYNYAKPKPTPRRRISKQLEQNRLMPTKLSNGNQDNERNGDIGVNGDNVRNGDVGRNKDIGRNEGKPLAKSTNCGGLVYSSVNCGGQNKIPTQSQNMLCMPNAKRIEALVIKWRLKLSPKLFLIKKWLNWFQFKFKLSISIEDSFKIKSWRFFKNWWI